MRSASQLLLFFFFPSLVVSAKFVIEPCDSSNSCKSLLSYRLPFDSKLSEIAYRFQTNVTDLLASNAFDPTNPLPGNEILPENTVIKVPVSCPCVDGIRRSVSTVYTVQAIDTVDFIAVGFGGLVSAEQIIEANGLSGSGSGSDPIRVGQKLVIPLPCYCFNNSDNGVSVVYLSYVVGEGESLRSIGEAYGITVMDLVRVNGLGSAVINTGDTLAVPIQACSSAYLHLNQENLLVPNASYVLTAFHCVQCTCDPKDLILRCSPSPFASNCKNFKCKGTHLFIGDITEWKTNTGCKVMRCLYRGYYGHRILSRLSISTELQCSESSPYPPPDQWTLPPADFFKLNFHSSMDPFTKTSGGGGIIRDHRGIMVAAFAEKMQAHEAISAEIQALISGLKLCINLGINKLIIEGDNLILIENLLHPERLPWELVGTWRRVRNLLSSVEQWRASFCRRSANRVADALSHTEPNQLTIYREGMDPLPWSLYRKDLQQAFIDKNA